MVDIDEFKSMGRQIITDTRHLRVFRSLMKKDGGRLTDAGKAVIQQGLAKGISQSKLAKLLEITPAAVSYHAR
jgi:hypothetical protein